MGGTKIDDIRDTTYLDVTLNSKLKWDTHIAKISSAANRMIGLLWRNLRHSPPKIKEMAYQSYVRPKVEYCSSIWDPHTQKDINKLEMVQKRGARFVANIPHRHHSGHHTSISATVQSLGWKSLKERRQNNRLLFLFKVSNGLVDVPPNYQPVLRSPQPPRGNQFQYQRLTAEVEVFQYSFLPRTITDWNSLSPTAAAADSLESLKRYLD